MEVIKLPWDSDFFGYPVGQLELNENEVLEESFLKSREFELISVISDHPRDDLDFLKLVDEKVTLKCNSISLDNESANDIVEFDPLIHSFEQLRKLNLESGIYSRFNRDRNFKNGEYTKLYNQWIKGSVEGDLATKIFVHVDQDKICGFLSLSKKNASIHINLIAVNKDYRGKGIAKKLISETKEYCKKKNLQSIYVVTQKQNHAAMNLYLKNQFIIDNIKNIYHYWNR